MTHGRFRLMMTCVEICSQFALDCDCPGEPEDCEAQCAMAAA